LWSVLGRTLLYCVQSLRCYTLKGR